MKITNVEAFILQSPFEIRPPEGSDEARGVKHCLLIKVTTDEDIIGWSDVETAPHVGVAAVNAPESGMGVFEGLRSLAIGRRLLSRGRKAAALGSRVGARGRRGPVEAVPLGHDVSKLQPGGHLAQ